MRDITLGDTIYIKFTTRAFSTGVPTTLAGTPVVSAYVGSNLTQITAGVTLGVDHDGVTGLNLLAIAATSGNGFANGTDVDLVITTGTVDSVSAVGEVVGSFTIGRSAAAVDLANGADGLTALKTGIDGVPTTAEFNARTLLAADYFDPSVDTVSTVTNLTNLPAITTGWLTATGIAAGSLDGKGDWNIGKTGYTLSQTFPTNFADLAIEATTGKVNGKTVDTCTTNSDMRGTDNALLAASINLTAGAVDRVTLTDTTTTNADMRGTDSAATASALATAQTNLDTLTGADGATLATSQPNYAPNKVVPDPAGTAPTAIENRAEMDANSTQLAKLGTPIGADMSEDIANIPTVTEFNARTPTAAELSYIVNNAKTGVPVTFSGTGTTTTATLNLVDGSASSAINDQYKSRLLVFNNGTLNMVVTNITGYDGATKVATVTAVPVAITSAHTARLI